MYYINKIVGFLVSPIGGAIAGGVVAVVCARLGRKRLAKWIGGLTVAWLWIWMTPIMTWVVGVPLEREFLVDGRVPVVETFPDADAIVLLGGSMGIETNMSSYAEMATSADRVWQAVRLYKAEKAQFRTFLKMLIRRQLIGIYRHERAHGAGETVPMDELTDEPSVPPEQGAALDLAWDRARHEAAVEHVLTKTALSAKTKAVYRAHVLEGKSAEEVCGEFGIDNNYLRQIKFRVEKAIAIVEAELADE